MENQKEEYIKYSVIIPVYNCEKFIIRCIESFLKQKNKKMEIIVVDDGSKDNTLKILNEAYSDNSFVRIFNKKNTGVSDSRNFGIRKARGKYILFSDSDDYVEEKYFKKIDEILDKEEYDLINFGFYSDVENQIFKTISSDLINFRFIKCDTQDKLHNELVELWDRSMLYNIWNKVYKAEIIKNKGILFPMKNWGEDMEFNISYMEHINKFYNSDKAYYHYVRERKGSITNTYNNELFYIRKKEYHYFNNYFKKNNFKKEEYIEFSNRRFIERVVGCLEGVCASEISFIRKIHIIKNIINDDLTVKASFISKPNSKKMKLILFPIRKKRIFTTFLICKMINLVRDNNPALFNKLKNRR